MALSQAVQVRFTDPDSGLEANTLFIEERATDNKTPSQLYREAQTSSAAQSASCLTKTAQEESNVLTAQLCQQDIAAWGVRKLRVYPADIIPELRTTVGSIRRLGVGADNVSEVLQFSNSNEASLRFPASDMSFGDSTFYNKDGDLINVNFTFDGNRKIKASESGFGLVFVSYNSSYNIVELSVSATGGDIEAFVMAIYKPWGAAASTTVRYTPVVCDTGVVAGCEAIEELPEEEQTQVAFDSHVSNKSPTDGIIIPENIIWTEKSRLEDTVNVSGVDVERFVNVTFNVPNGNTVTLKFNSQ